MSGTGLRHGLYNALCALETGNLREDNAASVVPLKVGLWEQAKTRNQEVISNVSLDPISGTRIIERFAPRPYYFASLGKCTEYLYCDRKRKQSAVYKACE